MKNSNLLLIAVLAALITGLFAFRTAAPNTRWQYCTLTDLGSGLGSRARITIDYGQEKGDRPRRANRLKDADGKEITFDTVIDALNYMGQDGWKCIGTTPETKNGYPHYLLCKPLE